MALSIPILSLLVSCDIGFFALSNKLGFLSKANLDATASAALTEDMSTSETCEE